MDRAPLSKMGSWPFTRLHYLCNRCIAISGPNIQVLDSDVVDKACSWIITVGEDKRLNAWTLEGLKLESSRDMPKKATVTQLSPDGQDILVADKFGDVFSYPVIPSQNLPEDEPKKRDAVASHETPHGSLILGHVSIITALLLSHDGHYMITADRDEHIRVSRYPLGHIIERYCLGHRLFVSALCIPAFEPTILVSGGGDEFLYLWDWISGALLGQIPIEEAVRPFLRVQESKPRWHLAKKGTRKERRRKKAQKGDDQPSQSIEDGMDVVEDSEEIPDAPAEFVLAVAKVEAIDFDDEQMLLFSAHGASALFFCSYSLSATEVPVVRHVEFPYPVLDFVEGPGKNDVLVSLDTTWTSPHITEREDNQAVRLLSWQHGTFKPSTEGSPLVDTLNGTASLSASTTELASLNLYAALSLLPKYAAGEEEVENVEEADSRPPPSKRSKPAGRLKTKQALLRKQEEQADSVEEPEAKKIRLEVAEG